MNYVNDRFCELVQLPRNRQAILAMKKDVDDFLPSFCDSPAKLSRWADQTILKVYGYGSAIRPPS